MNNDSVNTNSAQEDSERETTHDNRSNKKGRKASAKSAASITKKTGRIMLRALILVVVFCVVIFGGVVISDMFFSDDSNGTTPEIITLTISGENVILENKYVPFDDLRTYLRNAQEKGELYTVAVINDTGNPADYTVYNKVVDLLAEFGIECEKMEPPATYDEYSSSTADQL